jgi:uncharacterized membrane protein
MTDSTNQTPATVAVAAGADDTTAAVVASEVDDTGATVVGVIGDDAGNAAVGEVVTDYDYAAIVAAFTDDQAAMAAYQALSDAESAGTVHVDGVLVFNTDADLNVKIQKMTDHSTRDGVAWGAVGGLVLGIIFPPSIIASTIAWGAVGGVVGKLVQEFHKSDAGAALAGTLGPNESGILALVDAGDVATVTAAMPTATKVRSAGVDAKTADSIKEAAAKAS